MAEGGEGEGTQAFWVVGAAADLQIFYDSISMSCLGNEPGGESHHALPAWSLNETVISESSSRLV